MFNCIFGVQRMNRKARYSIILLISGTLMFLMIECFMMVKAYQVEKISFTNARQSMVATALYRGMTDVSVMQNFAEKLLHSADSSGNISKYLANNISMINHSLDLTTASYKKTDSLFSAAMVQEGYNLRHKLSVVVSSFILLHKGEEFVIYDVVSKRNYRVIQGTPEMNELQKPLISFFFKGVNYNINISAYLTMEYRLVEVVQKLKWQIAGSILMFLIFLWIALFTITIIRRQIQLDELKNDFISNITHEVKTPLTTMMVAAGTLSGKTQAGSENLVQIIVNQAERLDKLFSNILNLSILREGRLNPDFQMVDSHSVIRQSIAEKNISLPEVIITADFRSEHPMILADVFYLRTALSNILDNSIKYGSPPVRIKITTENTENGQVISIADNGPGIPQKYQKRIFGKFFRVPAGNIHTVKGSGLGLYYVKLIMKQHKGNVGLISRPGEGTTVKLLFPHK